MAPRGALCSRFKYLVCQLAAPYDPDAANAAIIRVYFREFVAGHYPHHAMPTPVELSDSVIGTLTC